MGEKISFIDLFGTELELEDEYAREQLSNESAARAEDVAVLEARMDTFTALPAGSTSGDAELMDIRIGADGVTYPNAGDAVRGQIGSIEKYMTEVKSNNYLKSVSELQNGYVAKTGSVSSSTGYCYTPKIPVSEGDVVQVYYGQPYVAKEMRFVCAYDADGNAISASGAEIVTAYTVPTGVSSVVLSITGQVETVSNVMVTKNYEATTYEAYFEPYYIAKEEFVDDVLNNYELPVETVDGYNLIPIAQTGTGYYYGSSVGSKIRYGESTSYRYAIMPVKENTDYYISATPRWWAFTDDDDIVVSYGQDANVRVMNSGNATKFYFTIDSGAWNNQNLDTALTIVVSEGANGSPYNVQKPTFVSGLSQNMMTTKYGCAMPKRPLATSVGANETWYKENIFALNNTLLVNRSSSFVYSETAITLNTSSASQSFQYGYEVYDEWLNLVRQQSAMTGTIKAYALANCSALVIGDSTVAQNTMTQKMLDEFSAREKTLTLLGTQGTAPNNHEGRSGWSAKDYCTLSENNPFFNPTTNKFDFSYYMNNQSYSSVDFVVIQLGINDLYNTIFQNADKKIEQTTNYILEMLSSIYAFNASQKVLLNLPTALNSNRKLHGYRVLELLRNMFIRYNDYMQLMATLYNTNILRCSYCHLILDPSSDINDNVHPTATGYEKMAKEVVSQINNWQNS